MLQEAILLQKKAVTQLVDIIEERDEITFKAPTGSGKTYMMADFMDRILEEHPEIVFVVSTLSKGGLASQNFEKFCQYSDSGIFKNIKPHLISSNISGEETLFIPTGYNVYLLPRDLYKSNGRLMKGPMENFLNNITFSEFLGGQEKIIYLIKDECHIATNNLDSISTAYFEKVINISATPNLKRGQNPDVEITEEEAVTTKLIKYVELGSEEDTVEDAINKFESIKDEYRNLLGVNPCLIIQISNKNKADEELNNIIFPVLQKKEHQDLKWMLIVDDPSKCDTNDIFKAKKMPVSKWKDYAKSSTATTDIIIFKMVITEGWDIPRACMLYQVRDTESQQLDEQVMGRVRRNPRLLDFEYLSEEAQKLAMTAWIWGIVPEHRKKYFSVKLYEEPTDITDTLKIKTTRLKDLNDRPDFNVEEYLSSLPTSVANSSIFELGRKWLKSNFEIRKLGTSYTKNIADWVRFTSNIDKIQKESNKFLCDYSQSMVLATTEEGNVLEVSFAPSSNYLDNGNYLNIADWVWKRTDGKDKFSFDSDAEREWASILKDLSAMDNVSMPNTRAVRRIKVGKKNPKAGVINLFGEVEPEKLNESQKYLWGKNYLPNSDIRFEYYDTSILNSYPDFVMMDSMGRIHIFEVKSVNESAYMPKSFDPEAYKKKIENLKECYKQASIITGQIFYLPIMKNDTWQIIQLYNGVERSLTKKQFIDFVIGG